MISTGPNGPMTPSAVGLAYERIKIQGEEARADYPPGISASLRVNDILLYWICNRTGDRISKSATGTTDVSFDLARVRHVHSASNYRDRGADFRDRVTHRYTKSHGRFANANKAAA